VALAGKAVSAPQIAEAMGITRQGAQKQLNRLEAEGFFERHTNPRHERSPLYTLTKQGTRAMTKAMALQGLWSAELVAGQTLKDLQTALRILNVLYDRLDSPIPKKAFRE